MIENVAKKTAVRGRASGGLIILYNERRYKNVKILFKSDNYIFIVIPEKNKNLVIGLTYINDKTNIKIILEEIEGIINNLYIRFKDLYLIIGGDFNARIADQGEIDPVQLPSMTLFTAERKSLDKKVDQRGRELLEFCEKNDLYITNGRFPADQPANFTSICTKGKSVIDLVLCNFSALFLIVDFRILDIITKPAYFHLIVEIKIELNFKIEKKDEKIIKWKDSRENDFCDSMQHSPNVGLIDLDINEMANNITITISDIARDLGMIKYNNEKNKYNKKNAWYDEECFELKQKVEKFFKYVRSLKYPEKQTIELNKLKNNYFKLIENKKENYNMNIVDMICKAKDPKEFWEKLNLYRFINKCDNNNIDLKIWHEYFMNLFPPRIVDNYNKLLCGNPCQELDDEITISEIIDAIKKCKLNKAPGMDQITNEFFKNLPGNWIMYLYVLFNKIRKEEKVPDSWAKIVNRMLYKKGNIDLPENFRPIALANTILKIFTLIIYRRLYKWAEMNDKIPEWQAGFREKRGTHDHVFVLNAMVQNQLYKNKGRLYALFVDLKSAFPSVNHKILWNKLSQIGVSHKIINILIDLYSKANVVVKSKEGVSDECPMTIGVFQGETLSPLLFSLFLHDIEKFLVNDKGLRGVSINNMVEIIMLAFADDMIFFADTFVLFRRLVKILEDYFDENLLVVNITKTKALKFQKGGHGSIKRLPPLLYKNQKIGFDKEYLYLGVPFTHSGLFDKASKVFTKKGKCAIQPTLSLINRLKYVNLDIIKKLFKSLVPQQSCMLLQYGA